MFYDTKHTLLSIDAKSAQDGEKFSLNSDLDHSFNSLHFCINKKMAK